jgi:hypothetical protein
VTKNWRSSRAGAVLFETLLLVELLVIGFCGGYLFLIPKWLESLSDLQEERITYDGVKQ